MRRLSRLGLLTLVAAACGPKNSDALQSVPTVEQSGDGASSVVVTAGFDGDVLLLRSSGDVLVVQERDPGRLWPWASVTKQVVAVMVMQQVAAGRLALDEIASTYVDELGADPPAPTLRQLLQHRSGLPNPEDTPADADGIPSFYTDGATGLDWCLRGRSAPPAEGWTYNNCDYIVLGAVLERVTGQALPTLFSEVIADPAALQTTAFAGEVPLPSAQERDRLARYGASGGLVGSLRDLLRFDEALTDGRLLDDAARSELWQGHPELGFMALGQWSFETTLAGCDQPVRIIERRGAIGAYQTRNFIIPEHRLALALATEQPQFDFGEIWTGSGFTFDLLSAVVCER